MATVGTLDVLLRLNSRAFDQGIQTSLQKADRFGRDMQRVGGRMTAGLTLPLAAAGAAALKMAVDAEESANKFDVVMGGAADRVRRRFEQLHDTIPLTLSQMEALAAGVQDLLVPLGLAREEAAFMSADMVELAGDLASFNNVAAEVPLEAIKSALAGMSRPLRQFGVDVSQARLETLALEEGLIAQGEALDSAARAQAVMIAVQRDSADAMGDAARTADSAANSIRFLARDAKELGQAIGDILIPVVIPLVQRLNDVLRWMRDLDPAVQQAAVGVGILAAAIGPLLIVLGTLIRSLAVLGAMLSPAGLLIVGIGAVASLLAVRWVNAQVEAARTTREFRDVLDETGRSLRDMGEEAARVTLMQFQRSVLQSRAEVERLHDELERAMQVSVGGRGMGAARQAELAPIREELRAANAELERQEALLQEAREAFFAIADAAQEAGEAAGQGSEAYEIQADLLARALDLDINRREILDAAVERRNELNELLLAGVGSLEREVALVRELNELNDSLRENVERRIGLTESDVGLVGDLGVQTREWSGDLEKVGPMWGPIIENAKGSGEAINEASLATQEWGMAVLGVASGFRGILGTVARIAMLFASGGTTSGLAGIASALPFFHTGGFMRPNSLGVVKPDEEIIRAGAVGATVMPTERAEQASAPPINLTVNVPPARDLITMTRDAQWRRAIDESIADFRDRGGEV